MFLNYNCIILCDRELSICLCQGIYFRPKQKNAVFLVTGPKKLGRVGREIFFFIIFF